MTETASTALAPLAVPGDTRAQVLAPLTDLPREQLAAALATRYLLGYSGNTRAAYARDLADFFTWCQHVGTDPLTVTRSTVDLYARDLTATPSSTSSAPSASRTPRPSDSTAPRPASSSPPPPSTPPAPAPW